MPLSDAGARLSVGAAVSTTSFAGVLVAVLPAGSVAVAVTE